MAANSCMAVYMKRFVIFSLFRFSSAKIAIKNEIPKQITTKSENNLLREATNAGMEATELGGEVN
jgi:hypothetical protein